MLNERSISVAAEYWAAQFGCPPEELFACPLGVVIQAGGLADYCGAFALFRDGAATASISTGEADRLRPILSSLSRGCSPEAFASALRSIATTVIGPAYIGYASSVVARAHSARTLTFADAASVHALQHSCDATEWEHGGSPIEHPSSGVFVGSRLVALAAYELWGGRIAHISVITHPDFRGRGFGRAAVAHLADRAVRRGLLPQYRTLESNQASIRVAESLGFEPYARSVSVRLTRNA